MINIDYDCSTNLMSDLPKYKKDEFELWRDIDEYTVPWAHNRGDWVHDGITVTPQPDKECMFNNRATYEFHATQTMWYTTC